MDLAKLRWLKDELDTILLFPINCHAGTWCNTPQFIKGNLRDEDEHPVFHYDCQFLLGLQIKMLQVGFGIAT